MKFSDLGLAEPFTRATQVLGYQTTTPIQTKAIPVVLSGRDLIGCAQTGTGKTAAFTLPMLDRLLGATPRETKKQAGDNRRSARPTNRQAKPRSIRALVLAPTRELAAQIGISFDRYGRFTPLRQTVVFGGVSQHHQVKALRHGVDTLVATPGRLLDLMEQGHIDLARVEILVFDEADQMLDMGFLPALKRIVAAVPKRRQTLMFSATMPEAIRQLAQQWLSHPASIQAAPTATPADRIQQSVHLVDKKRKPDLLSKFLTETPRSRTLVFSRTKHGADKIVKRLQRDGIQAAAIHGNKSQGARTRALAQFKSKSPPVLVATDIAARGLDINNISHVVNFDLPDTPETYVHRIGRTGRAGADGIAVSFCAGDERGLLREIERLTKIAINIEPVVDGFEPTDPISYGRRTGRGQGGAETGSSKRPRRRHIYGNGAGSSGNGSQPRTIAGSAAGGRRRRPARATENGSTTKRSRRRAARAG